MLARCARRFLRRRHYWHYCTYHGPEDRSYKIIGNREIVGHGINGQPSYIDTHLVPFPAIRYRECTPEIMALREKERGDWRKLSCDEKKCLYRASFRQTFAEFDATIGVWKSLTGVILLGMSLPIWIYYWIQTYVTGELPQSFSREARIAQYYRTVALHSAPLQKIRPPAGAEPRTFPKNNEELEQMWNSE